MNSVTPGPTSLHSTVMMKMAWERELCSFMLVALKQHPKNIVQTVLNIYKWKVFLQLSSPGSCTQYTAHAVNINRCLKEIIRGDYHEYLTRNSSHTPAHTHTHTHTYTHTHIHSHTHTQKKAKGVETGCDHCVAQLTRQICSDCPRSSRAQSHVHSL